MRPRLFMSMRFSLLLSMVCGGLAVPTSAAILTVTTTNNVSPAAGETSLAQAMAAVKAGDEIRFNIPGAGPHYIATPPGGYPLVTNDNVTIDGYTQPGASANSNSILAPNNAKIRIVLDSRGGGYRALNFPLKSPTDDPSYTAAEGATLAFVDAKGIRLQGVSFLGVPEVNDGAATLYFVAFGRGASGRVSGCWLGVDPDGQSVAGASIGIVGFQYRERDEVLTTTNTVLVNDLVIGVAVKATNAVQQFNVFAGMPIGPMAVEGANTRIAGNFVMVLPDGLHDFDVALDGVLGGRFQGAIQIGRSGNNTLIGTDGDGVNDANERNIFGGMLPLEMNGFQDLIHFYSLGSEGTNIVVAGNYFGIGIDGKTKFTNGVPILNGAGDQAQYRVGSNLDGVSDALEGNLAANNYPPEVFPAADFQELPEALSFFSQPNPGASFSLRGNSLINNFPFPASPLRDGGVFLLNYYSRALTDPSKPVPVLSTNSTRQVLRGSVPVTDTSAYAAPVIVDVYVADPVGITNGMAAAIPALPQGFVQGVTYLGSFTEGSADDKNASRGEFEFDVSRLNIAANTLLTVTANYTPAVSSGEAGQFTEFTRTGDNFNLVWTGGALESAPSVLGPWTVEESSGTSRTVNVNEAEAKFFRLTAGGSVAQGSAPPLTSPFSNAVAVP